MVDTAVQDQRFISPAALLGSSSAGAATMTTIGLTTGPGGMLVAGVVAVVAAGGVAAVRKFAPGTANKLGLRKPGDKAAKGTGRKDLASRGGGLGRKGLLGALRGKTGNGTGAKAAGASSHGTRGAGLLGAARRVAGKAAQLAKRGAIGATGGKKQAGLLGARGSAAGKAGGKGRGAGLVGGKGRKTTGAGGGRSTTGATPRGTKSGSAGSHGTTRGSSAGASGTGRARRLVGGAGRILGRGVQGLFGGSSTNTTKPTSSGGKPPKGVKGRKGSGLLGGGKTKKGKAPKNGASKDRGRGGKPRAGKDKSTKPSSGKPSRGTSAGAEMPNPFASRYEAVSGAAPLEIERANDLIDYVNHAPDYAEAQARRWSSEADAIVEQIDVAPEFADALRDFAAAQHQQVVKVREYGDTFRRAHNDKLAKIERADPREEKWDIGKNRP